MQLLYSKINPFPLKDNDKIIVDTLVAEMKKADSLAFAVGYVSQASLEELDRPYCWRYAS